MPADTPTPSEVLIPDLYLADQASLSVTSVIECEIASRNTRKSHTECNQIRNLIQSQTERVRKSFN